MLSDENILNFQLHRPNKAPNGSPFLTGNTNKTKSVLVLNDKAEQKSKLVRPETIKRANNDSFRAAAIGDLDWLKQTLKITNELAYDKNGFCTLHLASLHGRKNILQFLIDECNYDPNISSLHGWKPVHLCINNHIGSRAIECLCFLVQKGADMNVKNDDGVYPIHMAASEGQVDCLKILIDLKADASVVDLRGNTALDLAKLWGHRYCAKLLSFYLWQNEKKEETESQTMLKRLKLQGILKEAEKSYFATNDNKEDSEKKFNTWLASQGFFASSKENKEKSSTSKLSSKENKKLNAEQNTAENVQLSVFFPKKDSKKPKTQIKPASHEKPWNHSTKTLERGYITNLSDFFPRDTYTLMPDHKALLTRELKGMTLEEVKEFMQTKLNYDPKILKLIDENTSRPFYHKVKTIIDVQTKNKFDEIGEQPTKAALHLTNDTNTFPYKQTKSFLGINEIDNLDSRMQNKYQSKSNHQVIIAQLNNPKKLKDDKLEVIRRDFSEELSEFMKDKRHGYLEKKYDKVFIC